MFKYKIEHRRHYVYSYADRKWYDFDNGGEAFNFMKKEMGI